jgi:hypothetical protein
MPSQLHACAAAHPHPHPYPISSHGRPSCQLRLLAISARRGWGWDATPCYCAVAGKRGRRMADPLRAGTRTTSQPLFSRSPVLKPRRSHGRSVVGRQVLCSAPRRGSSIHAPICAIYPTLLIPCASPPVQSPVQMFDKHNTAAAPVPIRHPMHNSPQPTAHPTAIWHPHRHRTYQPPNRLPSPLSGEP